MNLITTSLHWLGFGLCHQLPERSFFGGGVQVPVCARDTGIYLGFMVSLATMAFIERRRRRSGMPDWPVLALGLVFIGIMAFDGVTSYAGWRATTNEIRLITGLLAGWALPLVVLPMLNSSLWADGEQGRALDGPLALIAWLSPLPVTFALVFWVLPSAGVFYPLLVALSIVATFVSVNMVIVSLIPRFERSAVRIVQLWPMVLAALGVSALEIGAAAWLRVWLLSLAGLR